MIQIAGGIIWNKKKGVVIVSQNHNSWSLPKGHVEAGEDDLTAALREIKEESGIPSSALTLVKQIASYSRKRTKLRTEDSDELRNITLFFFTTDWIKLCPEDPENPEAIWVKPEEVPATLTNDIDKSEFKRIYELGIFEE